MKVVAQKHQAAWWEMRNDAKYLTETEHRFKQLQTDGYKRRAVISDGGGGPHVCLITSSHVFCKAAANPAPESNHTHRETHFRVKKNFKKKGKMWEYQWMSSTFRRKHRPLLRYDKLLSGLQRADIHFGCSFMYSGCPMFVLRSCVQNIVDDNLTCWWFLNTNEFTYKYKKSLNYKFFCFIFFLFGTTDWYRLHWFTYSTQFLHEVFDWGSSSRHGSIRNIIYYYVYTMTACIFDTYIVVYEYNPIYLLL